MERERKYWLDGGGILLLVLHESFKDLLDFTGWRFTCLSLSSYMHWSSKLRWVFFLLDLEKLLGSYAFAGEK